MVVMTLVSLLGFAGLCLMLALIPGPDTFLILRISLNRASAGIAAAAGCGLGAVMWGALVGVGLAALLEQSAEVFRVVKIAGGLYLMYLGVSALLKARKARKAGTAEGAGGQAPLTFSRRGAFGAGALSTLLNPKVGLFYLAVVPPVHPTGRQHRGHGHDSGPDPGHYWFPLSCGHCHGGVQNHEVVKETQGQRHH